MEGAQVQDVARDDGEPYGETRLPIQDEHKPRLDGCALHPMAAEGIERIVPDGVGKGGGVNIAPIAELRVFLSHMGDERLEEGNPACVFAHHGEVHRIAPEGARGNVIEKIGGEGLADEVVARDPGPVLQDRVKQMRKHPLILPVLWKSGAQDLQQP